ncbi:MAG: hemerythrin domain-containing protein [Acidihalobacter sp.]
MRPFPPALRHQQVFSGFDALEPGESLVFITDRDARPLLGQFAALRPHRYLWLPQAASGERWIVWLSRREDDFAPTIGEVLQADHGRLDALLDLAIKRAASGKPAGDVLADFCWGLRRHFRIEEQRLFPAFVEAGGPGLPTQVMASEHRDIERQLLQLENDPAPSEAALNHLRRTLDHHCFKEEGVLYPMLDVSLGVQRMGMVEAVFREIGWEALNR